MSGLSVVIPAYLEAENLAELLPKLQTVLAKHCEKWEILVVDSVSPLDATPAVCARTPGVRHIARRGGNHYGDAIRTGFSEAALPYVAVMDADGSHSPEELPNMLAATGDHEIVIASRYIPGGDTRNPGILIFMSWIVNISYRLILRIPLHDISNSFRIYRREQLQKLELQSSNFEIVEEILIKLILLFPADRILETPTCFQKRKHGESKRDLVRFAFSYFSCIWRLLKLKYRTCQTMRKPS